MPYTREFLLKAHLCSSRHEEMIKKSTLCGCFFCETTFPPQEIDWWVDKKSPYGPTATCPYCDIDAVVGDASDLPVSDPEFLSEMNKLWFGTSGPIISLRSSDN
jgi:hypothetical protein